METFNPDQSGLAFSGKVKIHFGVEVAIVEIEGRRPRPLSDCITEDPNLRSVDFPDQHERSTNIKARVVVFLSFFGDPKKPKKIFLPFKKIVVLKSCY